MGFEMGLDEEALSASLLDHQKEDGFPGFGFSLVSSS